MSTFSPRPITAVADGLGIPADAIVPYGRDKAKVELAVLDEKRSGAPAKLILVSAITPTPAGEGKTTTSIGLADGLAREGQRVALALREPSLGPVMGMKGGGTGGGRAQLTPATSINLHFTGDFHAITAAHNLLAAAIDNHIHFRSELNIDPRRTLWRRVMDMNDRALRNVVIGLGGPPHGMPRETGFDITAASELMAMLCLATGVDDLRARLKRTLVAFTRKDEPVLAEKVGVVGAMMALLAEALQPNLVQTREGTPAFVHGGPFANIAHGCNSILATRMALHFADWAVTEAGFAFDLGAEKFFDIKCTTAGLNPAAVVLVATLRALKMHGGVELKHLSTPDPDAVDRGLPNLRKHIENVQHFGQTPIVAINRFGDDDDREIERVRAACAEVGVPFAVSDHFARGGDGARELACVVMKHAVARSGPVQPLYRFDAPVPEKILTIAQKMYGARGLRWTKPARDALAELERFGYAGLPVCIAKTQKSLSDDPKKLSRPVDFDVTIQDLQVNAGAGFIVVITGDIMRMPGLPRHPLAADIDLVDGRIVGVVAEPKTD